MATPDWRVDGQYIESCNCDYLCPCIYTNPQGAATHDHCYAMMVYRIDKGRCGDVQLDGLSFAFVIRSGKVMADGDWVFAAVVDEKANDAQRNALAMIASGEAGGTPGMIRDNLVSDFRGVEYKPISFTADGLQRIADIPGVFSFDIEGVASRNKSGDPYYIDNTSHPANTRLALARTKSLTVSGFGLDLTMDGEGNNGHYAPFSWTN
ncbi:MAG: DUF1326 domain-containing protein [Alphaproteobacteria bacterium]|nr:DUF1326 domain-containing protein [Alphaproteobacteria bacterium]